jgi:hypothetical protein
MCNVKIKMGYGVWLRRLQHESGDTGSGNDASGGSSHHGGLLLLEKL